MPLVPADSAIAGLPDPPGTRKGGIGPMHYFCLGLTPLWVFVEGMLSVLESLPPRPTGLLWWVARTGAIIAQGGATTGTPPTPH